MKKPFSYVLVYVGFVTSDETCSNETDQTMGKTGHRSLVVFDTERVYSNELSFGRITVHIVGPGS